MKKIIIIIIVLIFIYIYYKQQSENMDDNYISFLDNTKSLLVYKHLYDKLENIEITSLPITTKKLRSHLTFNNNTINNNGTSIYQSIIDPLINTIEIDNLNYNLIRIEWKISKLLYKTQNVGLELHIVLNNFKSINNVSFVIPLDLNYNGTFQSSNETLNSSNASLNEGFINIFYNKELENKLSGYVKNVLQYDNINQKKILDKIKIDTKNYKHRLHNTNKGIETLLTDDNNNNYGNNIYTSEIINRKNLPFFNLNNNYANIGNSFPDINFNNNMHKQIKCEKGKFNLNISYLKLINLNNLLFNKNQIPTYQCCKESIGPLIQFNFQNLENILMNNKIFYILNEEIGHILYITEPVPFDEDIGLYIRNVISEDYINYINPN